MKKWGFIGLEIIGGLAALFYLFVATIIGWFLFSMTPLYQKHFSFKPAGAAYVLKWGGMKGAAQVAKVLHAEASARSFTGDHLDLSVFQMKHFSEEKALANGLWHRGPLQNEIQQKAVQFMLMMAGHEGEMGSHKPVFPTKAEFASKPFLFCFPWVVVGSHSVYGAIILIYDPETQKLYVFDGKT